MMLETKPKILHIVAFRMSPEGRVVCRQRLGIGDFIMEQAPVQVRLFSASVGQFQFLELRCVVDMMLN